MRTASLSSARRRIVCFQVSARQKGERRASSHAKIHEIVENLLVRRIDHQTPTQVADSLGLEAEFQVHLREVSIELGVVELFLRRCSAEFQSLVEAALRNSQAQSIIGAIARAVGVDSLSRAKMLERERVIVTVQRGSSAAKVLVG